MTLGLDLQSGIVSGVWLAFVELVEDFGDPKVTEAVPIANPKE
jgi:hypothetical protein